MESVQRRQINSIVRVTEFMEREQLNDAPFTAVRKRIESAAVHLETLALQQSGAHSLLVGTGNQILQLRVVLREDHLLALARVGKQKMSKVPGIEKALKVPAKRARSETMIAFAKAMAKVIRPAHAIFVSEGKSVDFLSALLAAASALHEAERRSTEALRQQKAATAALASGVPAAREDVMILDALLLPRRRENKRLDHAWRMAKEVRGRLGRPKKRKKPRKKPADETENPET